MTDPASPPPAGASADSPLPRAVAALSRLTALRPVAELSYAEVAREAGLPWQTVRSLLGPRERFAQWLAEPCSPPTATAAAGDTRGRILAAAARLFAEKGFHGATLDEVAAAAGLTKGAVYWNFAGKHELFFALLDRKCAEMDGYLPQALEEAGREGAASGDPRASLAGLLTRILRRIGSDPEWPRLFVEFFGQTRDPAIRSRLGQRYLESYADTAALIRSGQPTGRPPAADPDVLAVFWIALIDGLVLAWLANPQLISLEEKIVQILDTLWQGLQQRATEPAVSSASSPAFASASSFPPSSNAGAAGREPT